MSSATTLISTSISIPTQTVWHGKSTCPHTITQIVGEWECDYCRDSVPISYHCSECDYVVCEECRP